MTSYYIENETELIKRLINGKSDAFGILYAKYKKRMIAFALHYVKEREIAEDVFQDAMMIVWERRSLLLPENSLAPLLFVIIRNRLYNLFSKLGKEHELYEVLMNRAIDVDCSTEMELEDHDLNILLDDAIEHLTPRQKQVFLMSRKEYKSHAEIAQELSLSVKTVQIHVSDALRTIKEYIARYADICVRAVVVVLMFAKFKL